MLYNFSDTGVR